MATLHIYEVDRPTEAVPRPEPRKLEEVATVTADGDKAKRAAKTMLEESGWDVRSLNWGPDPSDVSKPHVLHAYVSKKGAS